MSRPQIALITGASRGIGHSIARALAGRGMRLALTARDPDRLADLADELRAGGTDLLTLPADLLDENAPETIIAATADRLGPPTILINNAGSAPSARVEDTADQVLEEVLTLQVKAPLRLIRGVLAGMRRDRDGCIVQVASTAGLRGFPFAVAYSAAKHATVGLTRALAEELAGSGVRTYAVCPGFVDTDLTRRAAAAISARGKSSPEQAMQRLAAMNTIGRMHRPEEVADAVAWLCEERPEGCVYDLDRITPIFV
jgi:NAD(P)-dependent dehydrogenase (short-subunit alcohol dehydrogenase family)